MAIGVKVDEDLPRQVADLLDEESRRGYLELARVALQRLDLQGLTGFVIIVTRSGIRIRKP